MNDITYRKVQIFVQGIPAGELSETEAGYEFIYDNSYLEKNLPPVSLTLPLSEKPYHSKVLFPFFDGLIPEGWLLSVVTKNWKVDSNDRFGLLSVSCRDCIGDVSVRELL